MPSPDPTRDITSTRQPYPVGDLIDGQYVQARRALPVQGSPIEWADRVETITVSSSVKTLNPGGYNYCIIVCETAAVRFWTNGVDPTSTTGLPLEVGDQLILDSLEEVNNARFIRRDNTDAKLQVQYGRL